MGRVIIIGIVAVVLVVGGSLWLRDPADTSSPTLNQSGSKEQIKTGTAVGELAPDFELADYSGQRVRLSDFRGEKGVFVNFWASWCPFCLDEMPLMAAVQERFQGQYVTLAVNRGEGLETAKRFSDELGVTGRMILLLDDKDSAYRQYGGFAMPYSLFIDKDGVVRDAKFGPLTEQELEQKLKKIIGN